MKFKKLASLTLATVIMFGTSISYAIPSTSIDKVENIYKGQVYLKGKEWSPKIEYIVGKDNIPFDFDKEYFYKDNEYEGTLNAKKVIITPKQKIENKYEVTEYKTFEKTRNGTYSNNSNSNFGNTYNINESGYTGTIPRESVNWTSNWVRNRVQWVSVNQTTGWLAGNAPSSIAYSYYDPNSKKTVPTTLYHQRIISTEKGSGYKYSESYGNRFNYSRNNERLGYMAQTSSTYYSAGQTWRFTDTKPCYPTDYWGSASDKDNWTAIEWEWDENKAYSADEVSGNANIKQHLTYSKGSWWWKSLSGTLNKYRKGVYIKYRKSIPMYRYTSNYGNNVNLPDYIKDYTGTAKYKGTLSKKVEKVRYTCDYWDVNIIYEGKVGLKNVQVSGQIVPTPSQQGSQITFDLNTRYYPKKIEIFIPKELQSYFGKNSIVLNIKEEVYLNTKHKETLDLYIPETVDRKGNKLREPYKFVVKATRSDGNFAETTIDLEVSGSILDNLKTIILN